MQLQDFVTETLVQIVDGIRGAQTRTRETGACIIPHPSSTYGATGSHVRTDAGIVQDISFDVAVTAGGTSETKAGAGIFVAAIGFGGQGSASQQSQTVSRIQFSIPVVLPGLRTAAE